MARILVAEDDPHILRVIVLWIQRNGHEVSTARDGKAALEQIRQQPHDLLITDVNMPLMDGLELLAVVRAENLIPRPCIVLTSRCDQVEIEARADSLNAVVHPKPFSPQNLMRAIDHALRCDVVPVNATENK